MSLGLEICLFVSLVFFWRWVMFGTVGWKKFPSLVFDFKTLRVTKKEIEIMGVRNAKKYRRLICEIRRSRPSSRREQQDLPYWNMGTLFNPRVITMKEAGNFQGEFFHFVMNIRENGYRLPERMPIYGSPSNAHWTKKELLRLLERYSSQEEFAHELRVLSHSLKKKDFKMKREEKLDPRAGTDFDKILDEIEDRLQFKEDCKQEPLEGLPSKSELLEI